MNAFSGKQLKHSVVFERCILQLITHCLIRNILIVPSNNIKKMINVDVLAPHLFLIISCACFLEIAGNITLPQGPVQ